MALGAPGSFPQDSKRLIFSPFRKKTRWTFELSVFFSSEAENN